MSDSEYQEILEEEHNRREEFEAMRDKTRLEVLEAFGIKMEGTYDKGTSVAKYADEAMFTATPLTEEGELVKPKVSLVQMTADPLRVIAAVSEMYKGNPVPHPSEINRDLAIETFRGIAKSRLQAPFEFIQLHFLIEGVTRAFTHQMVRQRTAVFAQESMRFAVKENAACEVVMPPSIQELAEDSPQRVIWNEAVYSASARYNMLIKSGIPAEDARGILPTNIATRIHYHTDLKNLKDQSGNRLCSQAQQEWKQVWQQMILAIHRYGPVSEVWQQIELGRLFKPVCYQTGKCEFMAPTDRYCVIRDRVEAHHAKGEPPETWTDIDPTAPLHHLSARRA